jgi:hypothetical protein
LPAAHGERKVSYSFLLYFCLDAKVTKNQEENGLPNMPPATPSLLFFHQLKKSKQKKAAAVFIF